MPPANGKRKRGSGLPAPRSGPEARPFAHDVWSTTDTDEAIAVLRHTELLNPYWKGMLDVVTLLKMNEGLHKFDTSLHWDLLRERKMSIMFYGAQFSGKSQIIKVLTNDEKAIPLDGEKRTECGFEGIECCTDSRIHMIDTKGFVWPATAPPKGKEDPHYHVWELNDKAFKMQIELLHKRIRSTSAKERPMSVCVCIGAGSAPPEQTRLKEMLKVPHELLVPTFLLLTNIYAVDAKTRQSRKDYCEKVCASIDPNKRGLGIQFQMVNSVEKLDKEGYTHPPEGIAEFITTLIGNFKSSDGLTFARPPEKGRVLGMFGGGSSGPALTDAENEISSQVRELSD